MAFRTTRGQEIPAIQFARAIQVATQLRKEAVAYRAMAVAGSVRAQDLEEGLLSTLVGARPTLLTARDTPGMAEYAKQQMDDRAYNLAAEFTVMMQAIDDTTAWFEANFPTEVGGHLRSKRFVGDGTGALESGVISQSGRLSGLVTVLDALIAAID